LTGLAQNPLVCRHCAGRDTRRRVLRNVKVWQTVDQLRRRQGLVMSGEPREPGYRVVDWPWEARRVRSSVGRAEAAGERRERRRYAADAS